MIGQRALGPDLTRRIPRPHDLYLNLILAPLLMLIFHHFFCCGNRVSNNYLLAGSRAAPAYGTSQGTAGAPWAQYGAHYNLLHVNNDYSDIFPSRGTSRGTAFSAGACAPAGPGVAPPLAGRPVLWSACEPVGNCLLCGISTSENCTFA